MISSQEKNNLERFLSQYEDESSNQIVVLTLASIGEENIEEFSIRVVEKNLIGQKEKNNGVLVLIVRDSRAIRFETGYGLEGALTDAISSDIIHNVMTPEFRKGNYYGGIANGIVSIADAVKGEFKGTGKRRRSSGNGGWGKLIWIGIIIIAFLFQGIFGRRRGFVGSSRGWNSGGGSFIGGFGGGGFGGSGGGGGFGGFSGGGGSFGGGGASGNW